MKHLIYWLTQDLRNNGTNTDLYPSEEAFEAARAEIIRADIANRREVDPDDLPAQIPQIEHHLALGETGAAWALWVEHVKHEDDWYTYGSESVDIPSVPTEERRQLSRDIQGIQHFIRCARQGRSPASSTAEKVAQKLAKTLHAIRDDICLLDGGALEGMHQLVLLMAGPWATDADKAAIYTLAAQAAGKR